MSRKVILGLGNLLYRDEGLGIHAVQALQARMEQAGHPGDRLDLEWMDGGVLGMSLLPLIEESSHLLVLDAINSSLAPGSLIEMSKEQIPLVSGLKLSEHQVTFQDVLGLAAVRGNLPDRLHLLGLQPEDYSVSLELSPSVSASLPALLDRAEEILATWNLPFSCLAPADALVMERQWIRAG